MSVSVSVNGSTYTIPQTNETGWGTNVTSWIQAVSNSTLQKSGGTFTLTAEADLGATYGLKIAYVKSQGANISTVGILRLANAEVIGWRNNANGADLPLTVNSSDRLQFNSVNIPTTSSTDTLTNKTITIASSASKVAVYDGSNNLSAETTLATTRGGTNIGSYTQGDILYCSASNVLSKLAAGTSGQFLKTQGAGANPIWDTVAQTVAVASKSANYTVTTSDNMILCDDSGASFTLTLYAASGNSGKQVFVKKTVNSTNSITIDANSSETIDGALTTTVNTQYEEVALLCDGSNWHVINRKNSGNWGDVSWTPTGSWSTNTTYTGKWRRVGDSMQCNVAITTSGAPTAATLTVNLPSGYTIDTAKLPSTSGHLILGYANILANGNDYIGTVCYNSSSSVVLLAIRDNAVSNTNRNVAVDATDPATFGASDQVNFVFTAPISGWKA